MSDRPQAIERWTLPAVEGATVNRRSRLTVAELEELERTAFEEARSRGREAGLAAAQGEIDARNRELTRQADRFSGLLDALARPLAQLDTEIEQQLVQLAFTVARQLLRRELRADPAQVIGVIRDTVALLPAAARDVRVHLHPEDAALVRERLATPTADRAWALIEDPMQSRGGCRVTTETSQIDARLETRLRAALVAVLGEERMAEVRAAEPAQEP